MIHFLGRDVILGYAEEFALDAKGLAERPWVWMRTNAHGPGQFILALSPDAEIDAYTKHEALPLRILAPLPIIRVTYAGYGLPGQGLIGGVFHFRMVIET